MHHVEAKTDLTKIDEPFLAKQLWDTVFLSTLRSKSKEKYREEAGQIEEGHTSEMCKVNYQIEESYSIQDKRKKFAPPPKQNRQARPLLLPPVL
jgi:hypothetical protein